jgi:hypothetical protein
MLNIPANNSILFFAPRPQKSFWRRRKCHARCAPNRKNGLTNDMLRDIALIGVVTRNAQVPQKSETDAPRFAYRFFAPWVVTDKTNVDRGISGGGILRGPNFQSTMQKLCFLSSSRVRAPR